MKETILNFSLIAIYVVAAICIGAWMLLCAFGMMRFSQGSADWLFPNHYDLPLWLISLTPVVALVIGLVIAAASAYPVVTKLVLPMGMRLIDRHDRP